MPYDPIQGQSQGHGASEIPKIALFKVYLIRHLQSWARFLKFVLVFVSRDLELGGVPAVSPSRKVFLMSMKFGMCIRVDE